MAACKAVQRGVGTSVKHVRTERSLSTKTVLLLVVSLMVLVPYAFTAGYFTFSMRNQLDARAAENISADLDMLLDRLDGMMQDTANVAYLHLIDSTISDILRRPRNGYDLAYSADERTMQKAILHATSMNSRIQTVIFYSLRGNTYCMSQVADSQLTPQPEWEAQAQASPSHVHVAPLQLSNTGKYRLPILYALFDSLSLEAVGFVRIDYDVVNCLQQGLRSLKSSGSVAIWQGDTLLMDTGGNAEAAVCAQTEAKQVETRKMHGITYRLSWLLHADSGLKIMVYQQLDVQGSDILRSIYIYLGVLAMLLIAAMLCGSHAINEVGRSIKQLATALDNAKQGMDETITVPSHTLVSAELNQLMHSYNSLSQRITQGKYREYQLKLKQQQATMHFLESQVNPHFLYNSLNLIASLAQLGRTDVIGRVSRSLAEMMRYCVKGHSLVTLEEELAQTQHFILIVELRFPERLQVTVETDPLLKDCRLPKLILQPLIENSVKYGLDSAVEKLRVSVEVRRSGSDLVLRVEDNGPGFAPDRLKEVLTRMREMEASTALMQDEQNASIGLLNVHARVFMRYGAGYGVTLNTDETGSCVTVTLPIQRVPQEESIQMNRGNDDVG